MTVMAVDFWSLQLVVPSKEGSGVLKCSNRKSFDSLRFAPVAQDDSFFIILRMTILQRIFGEIDGSKFAVA